MAIGQLPIFARSIVHAEFDRLSDIPQRFLTRPALTDTAWDHEALRDQVTVLSGEQHDWKFHSNVAAAQAFMPAVGLEAAGWERLRFS